MTKAKQKWNTGDVFAVKLKDGRMALGQIIGREPDILNSATCAFYDLSMADKAHMTAFTLRPNHLIAALFCTRDLLDSGAWKVLTNQDIEVPRHYFPYESLRSSGWIGARVIGSGIINSFLNAYHGLEPWDDWKDPDYLDRLLISPDKKPKHLIFKRKGSESP